tara:strand:+ start:1146 stop:1409 length:264 start_codon:yes stop_codon:yes gene_type:complete
VVIGKYVPANAGATQLTEVGETLLGVSGPTVPIQIFEPATNDNDSLPKLFLDRSSVTTGDCSQSALVGVTEVIRTEFTIAKDIPEGT